MTTSPSDPSVGLEALSVYRYGTDHLTICRGCDAFFENGSFPDWFYGDDGLCPRCQDANWELEMRSPDGNVVFAGEVDPMDLPSIRFGGMNVDALRLEVIDLERKIEEWQELDEEELDGFEIDLEGALSELARVERELGVVYLRRAC
jgi:hypothetical protein